MASVKVSKPQLHTRPDDQFTMAEEGSKKRKRVADSAAKPTKKVAIAGPPATVTVSKLIQPKSLPPVIGMKCTAKAAGKNSENNLTKVQQ